jgi:hypothetical protein
MLNPLEQWFARLYFHGQKYLDFRVPLQIYDSFQGTFYISDIGGIEKNRNNAHFNFNPKYRYCPEFQNDYGEPISSNIAQILFDKNFSTLAVQLEGIDGDSRFLVLNASNREDALSQYAYLLDAKELKF